MINMKSKRINITMSNDLMNKLKSLAEEKGLSMSAYLRYIVSEKWEQSNQ